VGNTLKCPTHCVWMKSAVKSNRDSTVHSSIRDSVSDAVRRTQSENVSPIAGEIALPNGEPSLRMWYESDGSAHSRYCQRS
jgi:hypothetical protein